MPPKLVHISRALKTEIFTADSICKTLCLEGVGLYNGVHVSISSISDPQMSSLASESTSFCASSSAPSSTEAYLFRVLFGSQDIVQVALHCTALHCTALHCTALHCTAVPALWLCTPRASRDF